MKLKLHHFAYNIRPNNLELVIEFLEKLGCKLVYREKNARWCIIQQKPNTYKIQIIESRYKSIPIKNKTNTHICFLSDNPKSDIEEIKQWLKIRKIKFRQGSWSNNELWFDLPDVFTNFVIEIMHTSIIK